MNTWSLAMIVKNEEEVLARCLDSVAGIFDEIIIVDTGSDDKTVEIAKKYTDDIYHFKWINNFAKARNFAFSKATSEYIMWLDADDYFEKPEIAKLKSLKESLDKSVDAVYMKYNIGFDSNGNPTTSSRRERLVRRGANFEWAEPVHECIAVSGNTISEDITVTHGNKMRNASHSHRNLQIYEAQSELTPRGLFYFGRELKAHNRMKDAISKFEKFLDDGLGWREDNIRACFDLAECYNALDQPEVAMKYLFQSFLYAKPRSEACCKIARYFLDKSELLQSMYWYDLALHKNSHEEEGFFNKDYTDFIPTIQMCVLFDRLGEHDRAYEYHLLTKKIKPNDPSVLFNENYFSKKISN